jgi:hypothetical protein
MKVFLCAGGSVLGNNCRYLHGLSALRYSFQSFQIKAAPHLEFSNVSCFLSLKQVVTNKRDNACTAKWL